MTAQARAQGQSDNSAQTYTPAAGNGGPAGLLRKAGLAALVVFAAMLATPVLVFGSDLVSTVDYSDPLVRADPVTFMDNTAFGIIYGVQGIAVASALALMVVCLRRFLGPGMASDLMLLAGVLPVVCWLVVDTAIAQTYSSVLMGNILDVQADPAVRSMVGYSNIYITQGLAGAAGVGLAAWALLLHFAARTRGLTGRVYLSVATIAAVLAAVLAILGVGGFAVLLTPLLALMIGATLLHRSRGQQK